MDNIDQCLSMRDSCAQEAHSFLSSAVARLRSDDLAGAKEDVARTFFHTSNARFFHRASRMYAFMVRRNGEMHRPPGR